jgi:hypothetical protein
LYMGATGWIGLLPKCLGGEFMRLDDLGVFIIEMLP